MKNTRPRSLRTKMTLLSGGIIFAIAAGLTFASIFSAGRLFVTLPGTVISHTEPVIIQGSIEPAEAAEVRGEALPGVQIGSFLVEESPEGPAREALPTEASEMFHSAKSNKNPLFTGFLIHTLTTTDKVVKYGENNKIDFSEHPMVVQRGSKRTINLYVAVPDVA